MATSCIVDSQIYDWGGFAYVSECSVYQERIDWGKDGQLVVNLKNVGGQNDYLACQNAFLLYRNGHDFTYSDNRAMSFRMEYIDFEHPNILFSVVSTYLWWSKIRRIAALTFCSFWMIFQSVPQFEIKNNKTTWVVMYFQCNILAVTVVLSKKLYAARAAIILITKLLTDLWRGITSH